MFEPKDAIEYLQHVGEVESENRSNGLDDLRFSAGEQWPAEVQNSRTLESRPCLTINKIDAHIRQVTNAQRQQRPRIKVHPLDSEADPKIAEVLTGLIRHIEINSDAEQAYDTAFNYAARIGWGYWRIVTDFIREDSFNQDIFIQQIDNPFTVYFDPDSHLPDGSDAERCLITDMMTRVEFKSQFPGAETNGFTGQAYGDVGMDWATKDDIRIAEYFTVDRVKDRLVMLSDNSTVYGSKMPPEAILKLKGLSIVGDRESYRKKIMWRKLSAYEVLDEKTLDGRFIPVVPTYGDQMVIDGKRKKFGMVRYARDPQMMYNFWRTAMTESVAMAPKAKWLMAEGQDEGHENEWARANISAYPVLRYKTTDVDGREVGRPERLQPEPPPTGAMEAAAAISGDLQAVLGMYDPIMGKAGGQQSGSSVRAVQGQSEISNFHYYDNLVRSIKHTGRIALDLIPHVWDKTRIARIIGDDGKSSLMTLNEPGQREDETGQAIDTILNDVTVGTYDIVMEVGPSFNSKRQEAVDSMTMLLQTSPEVFKVAGDLIFRNMDFPGAEIIADRLAAANPLAQIDEKSDVPPSAQMMIKQLQTQLQKTQQQLQGADALLKSRADLENMKQESETKRELMRVTGKAHDTETWTSMEMQKAQIKSKTDLQTTSLDMHKAMSVEEIRAHLALLLSHMGNQQEVRSEAIERAI